MKKKLNIGMIGYGFMGRTHSNAFRSAPNFFDLPYEIGMKTLCGRTEGPLRCAAGTMGWEGIETDWRRVVSDPSIDIIDVATPGESHCEIAVAAAEAGAISNRRRRHGAWRRLAAACPGAPRRVRAAKAAVPGAIRVVASINRSTTRFHSDRAGPGRCA